MDIGECSASEIEVANDEIGAVDQKVDPAFREHPAALEARSPSRENLDRFIASVERNAPDRCVRFERRICILRALIEQIATVMRFDTVDTTTAASRRLASPSSPSSAGILYTSYMPLRFEEK